VADAFAGAESQVDQDKMSALNALASYGRGGLEEAALTRQRAQSGATELATANTTPGLFYNGAAGVDALGQDAHNALAAIGADQSNAFVRDASDAQSFLKGEQGVAAQTNATYYGQARQAVPGLRSNAAAIEDQYRSAYQERQAAVAAQAARDAEMRQQAILTQQGIQQQMAQAAELAAVASASDADRLAAIKRLEDAQALRIWEAAVAASRTAAPTSLRPQVYMQPSAPGIRPLRGII